METAVVIAFIGKIVPKLFAFVGENRRLRRNLEHDILCIRMELGMIVAAIQDHGHRDDTSEVQRAWIQLVRELAYSIEDCIDRYMHRVAREADASVLRGTFHRLKTAPTRTKFAADIRKLRRKSEEVSRLRECYYRGGGTAAGAESGASASTLSASETHTPAADLVGMDEPRDELLELIRETQGQPKQRQLKVISIVGFGGLGKTLLARQVFDSDAVVCQYSPRAWVRAAEKGAEVVLREILQKLGIQVDDGNCDVSKLSTSLRKCLESKRFFIVIDDMRAEFWNTIKNAFPAVIGVSSRVIVTTAIQYIANACSSFDGHVYTMRPLDEQHSRQLFLREAYLENSPPYIELVSEALKKCDGLPLALVTTAQFLQSRGRPAQTDWASLCSNLAEHLETEDTLARMKHVLVHSYSSLPDNALKTFLLYLGIFPSGRPVSRDSLVRRWSAEGFVEGPGARSAFDVAVEYFKKLVDRSIIHPIHVSNNREVKTCQIHSMMLEFILHKSICENFITSLYDLARPPGTIRWLSVHCKNATRARTDQHMDLSLVRSLTISGEVHRTVLEFSRCQLLRVLDLEECDNHLEDKHLREICSKLLLLRYLSLGGSISRLPKEIAKLKFLETLDVRRTKIEILPIQVIELPCLIHLFGKFKLEDVGRKMSRRQTFLSEKSNLQTISGFVAGNGFAQLMDHMKNLTKAKIWCESSSTTHLSKSIEGFIQRGTNVNDARSLSLNFKEWSEDLLNFSMEDSCYLSSLKLKGNNIYRLPTFVTMLGGLTELCLSSSNQLDGDILAALSRVRSLHYLKLVANYLEKFFIEHGALGSLRGLCIVVEFMAELEIQERALPHLESLKLLCKDLNGFRGTRIQSLGRLKEVALCDELGDETKHEWKEAAKEHPRRPNVVFVKTKYQSPAKSFESPVAPAKDSYLVRRDTISNTELHECPGTPFPLDEKFEQSTEKESKTELVFPARKYQDEDHEDVLGSIETKLTQTGNLL